MVTSYAAAQNFKKNATPAKVNLYPKNPSIDALYSSIPYINHKQKKMIGIMIKFLEIKEIIKYHNNKEIENIEPNINITEALLEILSKSNMENIANLNNLNNFKEVFGSGEHKPIA